jgi:branched-chain amino acid transport system permease protein
VLLPFWYGGGYWLFEVPLILCLALVVSGVNLSFGFAGELQLGQVFMFAAGAYVPMIMATRGVTADVIILMIIGGAVAALVGVLVAVPALRIGGWSLAMASLFLMIMVPDLTSIFIKYTGGLNGLVGIPTPTLFGHELGTTGLYEVTIVTTILWFAAYRNLVTSRYGVVFRILRESPVLTQSLGFSTFRLKASVYGLGALPAGIAGCLFGFLNLILSPSAFGLNFGIGTVAASLFGGAESVYGVFFGAAVLQLGPEQSASFASYSPVVYGGFLIIAATVLRGGISRLGRFGTRRVAAWLDPATTDRTPSVPARDDDLNTPPSAPAVLSPRDEGHLPLARFNGKALEARHVKMYFGGVKALRDVSLAAEPGKVTALIGSNGSGKTTLLNVICGYARPQEGSVLLDSEPISELSPNRRARLGVGRTFQTPTIPRGVSVRDVVASGGYARDHIGFAASMMRLPRYWRAQRADRAVADVLLDMVGLSGVAEQEAASLPLGTRRLVEVTRALCGEPGVVLLDEPASGLNDAEVERLADLLTQLAKAGATVIVIEHNFRFIRRIADIVHVMHLGQVIASGSIAQVTNDPAVIKSYLGTGPHKRAGDDTRSVSVRSRQPATPAEPTLIVDRIESGYGDLRVLRGLSLSVAPGAIEVVLGRNGVGKTTLLSNIAGLLPTWQGSILVRGKSIAKMKPYKRAAEGIALVQEGKRVFRQRTVWQNVRLGTHTLRMGRRERDALAREVLNDFPMLHDRLKQRAGGLSGGQQQMLLIAQALASRPKVLLLDEPSAGLAPAIVDELFQRLHALAEGGLSILLVEQLAEKALAIADHVTVIDSGRVVARGAPAEFADAERLEAAYFGT